MLAKALERLRRSTIAAPTWARRSRLADVGAVGIVGVVVAHRAIALVVALAVDRDKPVQLARPAVVVTDRVFDVVRRALLRRDLGSQEQRRGSLR